MPPGRPVKRKAIAPGEQRFVEECPICLDEMQNRSQLRCPQCESHTCIDCALKLRSDGSSCPMCRLDPSPAGSAASSRRSSFDQSSTDSSAASTPASSRRSSFDQSSTDSSRRSSIDDVDWRTHIANLDEQERQRQAQVELREAQVQRFLAQQARRTREPSNQTESSNKSWWPFS